MHFAAQLDDTGARGPGPAIVSVAIVIADASLTQDGSRDLLARRDRRLAGVDIAALAAAGFFAWGARMAQRRAKQVPTQTPTADRATLRAARGCIVASRLRRASSQIKLPVTTIAAPQQVEHEE